MDKTGALDISVAATGAQGSLEMMSFIEDKWKAWVAAYWWLRGVVAAITIAALVPSLVDVSRYELLASLHSVIVGWDGLMARLGMWIGHIPFAPTVSKEVMKTVAFSMAILVPSFFGSLKIDSDLRGRKPYESKLLTLRLLDSLVSFNVNTRFGLIIGNTLTISLHILVAVLYYHLQTNEPLTALMKVTAVGSVVILFHFIVAVIFIKHLRRAIVHFVMFLVAIEILYLLQMPIVSDFVKNVPCTLEVQTDCVK